MPLNAKTFRTRALTAVVFVVVMLGGLLLHRWSYFLLFSVIHFGCWFEYARLIEGRDADYKLRPVPHRWAVMLAGWCLLLYFTNDELQVGGFRLHEAGWWLGLMLAFLLPMLELLFARPLLLKNIGYSLTGLIYISLPLGLMVDLRNRWIEEDYQLSLAVPMLIIFSIWINDTMAYIVGSLIGRTSLSKVSPRKTWEGTVGGVILTLAAIGLIAYYAGRIPVVHAVIMAGLAAIAGTFGDLAESRLKRLAGVKDSGTIMPGHGGFLDRFDSLLFAAVAVWMYAALALN